MTWALLSAKTQDIYMDMLLLLISKADALGVCLSPKMVMLDFEKAAINAFQARFPNSTIKGTVYFNIFDKYNDIGTVFFI